MKLIDNAIHSRIVTLADVKEENRAEMIKSVLETPCIKLSFEEISKYPAINRLINFSKIKKEEFEKNYAFTPNDFIEVVFNTDELIQQVSHQMNIKALYRKAYEAFVLYPDDIEYDMFRARAEQEFKDCTELETDENSDNDKQD